MKNSYCTREKEGIRRKWEFEGQGGSEGARENWQGESEGEGSRCGDRKSLCMTEI